VKLDWRPKTGKFTLHVPPQDANRIRIEHGWEHSISASSPLDAVLFTDEPYAAAVFAEHATEEAHRILAPLLRQIAASWRYAPVNPSGWPDTLKPDAEEAYPLQLANLEYAATRRHVLVADEPGVGKTPTAIMYGNLLAWERGRPDLFRALVICPASIRLQWADRLRQWSTIPSVQISVVSSSKRGIPHTSCSIHWVIMSYEGAASLTAQKAIIGQDCRYDLVVLDEAHYLKTHSTRRSRAILGAEDRASSIVDHAAHIMALSGTPIPNRPREAYTLAKALCPESIDFMSARAFNERFNPQATRKNRHGRVVGKSEGIGRCPELQARLRGGFMSRHLFADAFPQLRLPLYDLVHATTTAPVRQALEAERLLDIDPETFTGRDGKIDGAVSTARKLMGVALAPQCAEYVQMLHDGGEDKIVLFGWHIEVLDIWQKVLDKIGVVRVDGRTSEAQKARAVETFQTNPHVGVILGNVLSLGTGTDGLQRVARRVVLGEPDWVIGNNEQCIKRLYRSGQSDQVLADIFVAPGSIAERVLASALRNGRVIHAALDKRNEL
jgi:SWI/SNF-related matrix-associated actin-dependent regulator of chromatin subfamily A-like protein 1